MMKNSIENIIKENKIMVIDGSMSTPLENRGVSLNSCLPKYLANFPYFTGSPAHSLVK